MPTAGVKRDFTFLLHYNFCQNAGMAEEERQGSVPKSGTRVAARQVHDEVRGIAATSSLKLPAPKGRVAERRNLRLKPALQAQIKSAIILTKSKKASSAQGYVTSVALATGWRGRKHRA